VLRAFALVDIDVDVDEPELAANPNAEKFWLWFC
jgi:hypothetical protein